ncbi:hypothetical protein BpHYR1_002969 [Brachionus plicatilis]|uniref:Uncharacterized protein n=1 Tax=Brachionus plicatilis TaxID=10195 RepID=A0A3M7PMC6_BRAPC|nr:hypothetical protein BpHYR1_002969 [Brachionus plicatilis]
MHTIKKYLPSVYVLAGQLHGPNFLAASLAAKVAVRPSRRSCSRPKKFLAASMAVCTVPNTNYNCQL